jgi:hypothetical protein
MAEHGHVVVDDGQEYFGGQVVAVSGREIRGAALGRVVDNMHHQPHETVDEFLPS